MKSLLVAALVLLLAGCSTTFRPYEGKTNSYEGVGGTRTTVDGIDIWETGTPPRKYKIIGVIDDKRGGGLIPMLMKDGDIAKKAKEAGGDALIRLSSQSEVTGYITHTTATVNAFGNTATGYGTSFTTPATKNSESLLVIKYLE